MIWGFSTLSLTGLGGDVGLALGLTCSGALASFDLWGDTLAGKLRVLVHWDKPRTIVIHSLSPLSRATSSSRKGGIERQRRLETACFRCVVATRVKCASKLARTSSSRGLRDERVVGRRLGCFASARFDWPRKKRER